MDREREKRLRGEADNQPSEAAIRAHQLGRRDLERSKKLVSQRQFSPGKLRKIIGEYAELGDEHRLAMKHDMRVQDVRRLLGEFGIHSIEDARKMVRNGDLFAELDLQNQVAEKQAKDEAREQLEQKLTEHDDEFGKEAESEEPDLSQDELDAKRAELQAVLQQEDKRAKFREAVRRAEQAQEDAEGFRIPQGREAEFRRMAIVGIDHVRRHFGGTRKQIRAEVRRLLPNIDVDMLR